MCPAAAVRSGRAESAPRRRDTRAAVRHSPHHAFLSPDAGALRGLPSSIAFAPLPSLQRTLFPLPSFLSKERGKDTQRASQEETLSASLDYVLFLPL